MMSGGTPAAEISLLNLSRHLWEHGQPLSPLHVFYQSRCLRFLYYNFSSFIFFANEGDCVKHNLFYHGSYSFLVSFQDHCLRHFLLPSRKLWTDFHLSYHFCCISLVTWLFLCIIVLSL